MKQNSKKEKSRRSFLSLGLLGGAGLLMGKSTKRLGSNDADEETVSMLTPDGKLVEVKKSLLAKSEEREKVRNQDILKWTKTQTKS